LLSLGWLSQVPCTCRKWGRRTYNLILNRSTTKQNGQPEADEQDNSSERRRLGRIVHDDRGSASVEWLDAPADEVRTRLEVEKSPSTGRGTRDPLGVGTLSIQTDETFDPYSRKTVPDRKPTGGTSRTDLRKLSEWIKLKRAMEERQKSGDSDAED
jgi:hypothetical protein